MADDRLTEQQYRCLLLSRDMTDFEIARELGIHPGTVNKHISAALKRLGVHDRREARRLMGMVGNTPGVADTISQSPPIDLAPVHEVRTPGVDGSTGTAAGGWIIRGPYRLKGSVAPTILAFTVVGTLLLAAVSGIALSIANALNPISVSYYAKERPE